MPLLFALVGGALPAVSEESSAPATPVVAMTFTLVRGEADACGPGCSRWIAAEGAILAATPTAFLEVSQALGGEKPPLFIHSDGGTVEAAMALGRLVRRAGLATIVARTDRSGALPHPAVDGSCHGACLYLLLAGTERAAAPVPSFPSSRWPFPDQPPIPFPRPCRRA